MIPIIVPEGFPLWGKIVIAAIVAVLLILYIRHFIKGGRP